MGNSIRQSNADSYDFHLALHSNASGSGSEGQNRGIIAFYYPGASAASGRRSCLRRPCGNLSPARPGHGPLRRSLAELRRTKAPAVLRWSWATTTMPPAP
ncbi:MAG: hypothetical protein ACLUNQ_00245 [Oscillospiraceae bacterium]